MAMFKHLNEANLKQLRGAIRALGEVWFHADGNIYADEKNSNDRTLFHNDHPVNRAAKYRLHLKKGDAIPADLDALEKAFIASYQQEESDKEREKDNTNNNNVVFKVEDDEEVPSDPVPDADPLKKAAAVRAGGEEIGLAPAPKKPGRPPVKQDPVVDPVVETGQAGPAPEL